MNKVGDKIYNLRKEKKVSQEELAVGLGVSRQTVSKWELNTAQPTVKNIETICKFFCVDIGYFFDLPDTQTAVTSAEPKHTEEQPEERSYKKEGFSTFKTVMSVVGVVVLVLFIIACGIACYVTISPNQGKYTNSVYIVNYTGIGFLIGEILAVAVLTTLIVIFIKKRKKLRKNSKKNKLPTLSDKLPTEGGRQDK